MDGSRCSRNKISCMLTYRYMGGLLYYSLYTYEYNLFEMPPPSKMFFKSLKNKILETILFVQCSLQYIPLGP